MTSQVAFGISEVEVTSPAAFRHFEMTSHRSYWSNDELMTSQSDMLSPASFATFRPALIHWKPNHGMPYLILTCTILLLGVVGNLFILVVYGTHKVREYCF